MKNKPFNGAKVQYKNFMLEFVGVDIETFPEDYYLLRGTEEKINHILESIEGLSRYIYIRKVSQYTISLPSHLLMWE
jgi:hypothetical protein